MVAFEHDLAEVRADGWFESLGAQMEGFRVLCDVVGDRFVAFSLIAGVRVTGLLVDSIDPSKSLVDFVREEEGKKESAEQQLTLAEFRLRLIEAMLSPDRPVARLREEMTREDLARVVGGRTLLLAALYGMRLERLVQEPGDGPPEVVMEDRGVGLRLPLPLLWERIRTEVQRELGRAAEGPFALDLSRVEPALGALAKGRPEEVIELLGNWPGPLASLLRTPAGLGLGPEEREQIGRGVAALAEAYRRIGRTAWAEELYRLGLQYATEGPVAALLFRGLADSIAAADRPGEAIAPYRRALALGDDDPAVLVSLGRSFALRRRHVAAVECFSAALLAGAEEASVRPDLERSLDALGDAGRAWRARLPGR